MWGRVGARGGGGRGALVTVVTCWSTPRPHLPGVCLHIRTNVASRFCWRVCCLSLTGTLRPPWWASPSDEHPVSRSFNFPTPPPPLLSRFLLPFAPPPSSPLAPYTALSPSTTMSARPTRPPPLHTRTPSSRPPPHATRRGALRFARGTFAARLLRGGSSSAATACASSGSTLFVVVWFLLGPGGGRFLLFRLFFRDARRRGVTRVKVWVVRGRFAFLVRARHQTH